jgi:type IV pilus assembly protein PilB
MTYRIGELLVKKSIITEQQLNAALELQKQEGTRIGEVLVNMGIVSESDILNSLSEQFGIPLIDLEHTKINENIINTIPVATARRYSIMPVRKHGNVLTIAIGDPARAFDLKEISLITGCNVHALLTTELSVNDAIERYYEGSHSKELNNFIADLDVGTEGSVEIIEEEDKKDIAMLESDAKQPPVVKIVNHIFSEAIKENASDIHIEPGESGVRVRYRVDGILYEIIKLPLKYKDGVTTRIKVLSKMDISEKRHPQDGRLKIQMTVENKTRSLDVRVSTTPTLFGQKIVMRLLDKEGLMVDLSRLGFEPESFQRFEEAIFRPWGMVLVTGPTGSGKTNTLYSAIGRINTPEVNIMTVEDPVEFNIPGINQVQVQENIGLSFASILRSFLRQDPNIILVGEIRDSETAEIAVKASLTGHLVLSTLHTNDAPSAVPRLIDMGVDSYLVATSVILIIAQRLVRRLCIHCKEEVSVLPMALMNIGFSEEDANTTKIYKPKGCDKCSNTGYKGRVGLFEAMAITDSIRSHIFSGVSAAELRKAAIEDGMITLRQSGLTKIKMGITTMEEVIRETF